MIQSWADLKGFLAFCQITHYFKGTVNVILSDPQYKDSNSQFATVPLKLYSDKKMWKIHRRFSDKKVFFFLWVSSFLAENPQMKINSLKLQKHWYLIHTWSDNHVFRMGLRHWDLYQLFPTSFSCSRNPCEFILTLLYLI